MKKYILQLRGAIVSPSWSVELHAPSDKDAIERSEHILKTCPIAGAALGATLWNGTGTDPLRQWRIRMSVDTIIES